MEIVVFAKSIKHGRFCVAGKSTSSGEWIRIVANENGDALDSSQVKIRNPYGSFDVKPLQKITTTLGKHAPLAHQPENYIISEEWHQNYYLNINDINNYCDTPEELWNKKATIGANEVLHLNIQQSLYLVKVESLNLYVHMNKNRASFSYNEVEYDLPSTDPNFMRIYNGQVTHTSHLCISLGEAYKGSHYKIVASIL